MSYRYPFAVDIDLFVQGRITQEDAARQAATAKAILQRLEDQPGLILADEVGMGKTYVALAVAVSVALADRQQRPVVVMVPPSLHAKWPRDFDLFCQRCIPEHMGRRLRCGTAERTVQFFKLLDDPLERRCSVIFLTHGAMSRQLADPWVKLALIRRALYRRHHIDKLRKKVERALPGLLQMRTNIEHDHPGMLSALLNELPERWLKVMRHFGYEPDDHDDPVPAIAIEALDELDLRSVFEVLHTLPARNSKYYNTKVNGIRRVLADEMRHLWAEAVKSARLQLPLLVMDEAHHLKNARTQLASLFYLPEAEEDAAEVEGGPLAGVFERMLFLTATPFQLGHHELCSVLERFKGIAWASDAAPSGGVNAFGDAIDGLWRALDETQQAALRLDTAWGTLSPEDLKVDDTLHPTSRDWWRAIHTEAELTEVARTVTERFQQAQAKMRATEALLAPWVIRHLRPRHLPAPFTDSPRRQRLPGAAIGEPRAGVDEIGTEYPGITVAGEALLPFLLAARLTATSPETRPVFAEGLASSYEAFLYTRKLVTAETGGGQHLTDEDDDATIGGLRSDNWHLEQLTMLVPQGDSTASASHPKIAATLEKVLALWLAGEKVLLFCHYIVTGRLLRSLISERIMQHVLQNAAGRLSCSPAEAEEELERIGDRFFKAESPWRAACDGQVESILASFESLGDYHGRLVDVARRYIRTPTFLARFFPLDDMNDPEQAVAVAFEKADASGFTLKGMLADFFRFLDVRCGQQERKDYIDAIDSIQVGTHRGDAVQATFSEDEIQDVRTDQLVPNVRLVNGGTRKETRQRLMLAFNTPFYPEILIASSVLAEGVDLHLNCRHVIHHDLSWNPSSLEQRNGRIDRIGAKAERCGQPIDVYYPYIAETQDDKMYQVVMDRDRWFNVVMGERYKVDARSTDKLAERLPFPEEAAQALAFKLGVIDE